ncbi:MAG TPA: class I SAM-dependent methyltransferase [Gemmatimonadaceae bacterium]|jgi:2-polyprenyl-3-methyl-5-hydroxy-6-metoxy-1,4-benzoquinol methylase
MATFTKKSAAPLSGTLIARHWNQRAQTFDRPHPRLRLIANAIARLPGNVSTLLDIGCGPGTLRSLLPATIEYFGVDIAGDVIPVREDPEHFVIADLNHEDDCFPGRRFTVVVASGMFEYVRDPDRFLLFVERKLSPDGHFILTYLNRWRYRDAFRRLQGLFPTYPDPHLNFMSVPAAVRLLKNDGFTVERSQALTRSAKVIPGAALLRHLPLSLMASQFLFVCCLM